MCLFQPPCGAAATGTPHCRGVPSARGVALEDKPFSLTAHCKTQAQLQCKSWIGFLFNVDYVFKNLFP